jgi:hypothetical protein
MLALSTPCQAPLPTERETGGNMRETTEMLYTSKTALCCGAAIANKKPLREFNCPTHTHTHTHTHPTHTHTQ